jgi:hypothetical protein
MEVRCVSTYATLIGQPETAAQRTSSRESTIELFSRFDRDNIIEFGAAIEIVDRTLPYRLSSSSQL